MYHQKKHSSTIKNLSVKGKNTSSSYLFSSGYKLPTSVQKKTILTDGKFLSAIRKVLSAENKCKSQGWKILLSDNKCKSAVWKKLSAAIMSASTIKAEGFSGSKVLFRSWKQLFSRREQVFGRLNMIFTSWKLLFNVQEMFFSTWKRISYE